MAHPTLGFTTTAEKLKTKSDGIDVTGEVQCDSLDVDGAFDVRRRFTVGGNMDFTPMMADLLALDKV